MKFDFHLVMLRRMYYQTTLDVPDELLEDGQVPDLHNPLREEYEEWVTENLYTQAISEGPYEESIVESDWEEA